MKPVERALEAYAGFVVNRPLTLLLITALITAGAFAAMPLLEMKSLENADMLPENTPVVKTMNYVEDSFGWTTSGMIVIETDPNTAGSSEVRDVRDYRVLEYADVLAQQIRNLDDVIDATSAADAISAANGGRLPQSEKNIREAIEKTTQAASYMSSDYSMSLVRITMTDDVDAETIVEELEDIVANTPRPEGIKAAVGGDAAIDVAIDRQIGPDMEKTSMFSLAGIFIIIYVVFRSLRYSLTSLSAIIFGNIWAFGFMAAAGITLSSMTSGASSMIMGIGVDFGIQVVSRFRHELSRKAYDEAMRTTIKGVTVPMLTTTAAALIGFRAMSLGQLTLMEELGNIMSLGVLFCMIAAITVIPAVLVTYEKYFNRKKGEKR